MGGRVISSKDWTLPWPCPGNRGDRLLSWFSHRQLLLFSGEADFGGDQTSSKCMVESFSPMIMNCLAWCHIVTPICCVSWGNLNSGVICMMNLRRFLLPDLLTVIQVNLFHLFQENLPCQDAIEAIEATGFVVPNLDPLSLTESSCRCRSKCQFDCQVCNLGRDTCCCQVCARWNSGSSRRLCFFGVSKSRLHWGI